MSQQASVGGPRAPQGSLLRLPFDGNTPPSVGRVRAVKSPSFTARFRLIEQASIDRQKLGVTRAPLRAARSRRSSKTVQGSEGGLHNSGPDGKMSALFERNGLLFLLGSTVARVTSLFAPCAPFLAPLCAPRAPFLTSFGAPCAPFLTSLRTRLRRLSGRRGGRGAGLGSSRGHHQNCRRGHKSKRSRVSKKSKSASTTDPLRFRMFTHVRLPVCCPPARRINSREQVLI